MYGIYSHVSKKFVYGIREPTKSKAWKKLKEHIGKDVYKWRFQAVKIDESNDIGGLNMEIKVLIEAPALTAVLERLIGILEKGQALNVLQGADKEVAHVAPSVQSVQSVPVQQAPVQQPTTVPTQAPGYTLDQLSLAGSQLIQMGESKRNELMNLLATFGIQALTELPQEQYGAFATKLRELGAQL